MGCMHKNSRELDVACGPRKLQVPNLRRTEVHLAESTGSGALVGSSQASHSFCTHLFSAGSEDAQRTCKHILTDLLCTWIPLTSPVRFWTSEGIRDEVLFLPWCLAPGCVHLVGDVFHFIMCVCALCICMSVFTHVFPHVDVLTKYHQILSLPSLNPFIISHHI